MSNNLLSLTTEKLAKIIYEDMEKYSLEIYIEMGAGDTGAKNYEEYKKIIALKYFDESYQQEIMLDIFYEYKFLLEN